MWAEIILSGIKLLYWAPCRIGPYLERQLSCGISQHAFQKGRGTEISDLSGQCNPVCMHIWGVRFSFLKGSLPCTCNACSHGKRRTLGLLTWPSNMGVMNLPVLYNSVSRIFLKDSCIIFQKESVGSEDLLNVFTEWFFTVKDSGVMQLSQLVLSLNLNHIFTVLVSGNHLSAESLQGLGNLHLVTFSILYWRCGQC